MKQRSFLLVALLPALGGCGQWFGGPVGVQMWATPESSILFPDSSAESENDVYSATNQNIRLESAVNETISFQLAFRLDAGTTAIRALSIRDLQQQDQVIRSSEHVRLFRQERLHVEHYPSWFLRLTADLREAREYPDILIPLSAPRGGLPIVLEPGRCEAVWVDLTVPPGTEPGIYRSQAEVVLQNGLRRSIALVLTVHPFSLPLTQHLPVIMGVDTSRLLRQHLEVAGRPYAPKRLASDDPAYGRAVRIIDDTIRLLHEHRCSAMLTDVQPLRKLDSAGRLELDWTDYDRLVASVLDGSAFDDRIPAQAWPIPVDDRNPAPELHGGWGSQAYAEMLVEHLRQSVAHFRERGWLERHFVWIPLPPAGPTTSPYGQFAWMGTAVRRADPGLSLVCALAPQRMKDFGCVDDRFQDLSPWVGIWAPPASVADTDTLQAARKSGKRTWLQPNRPPFSGSLSFIAPAAHPRSLAWQCYRSGCEAIFLPHSTDWPEAGEVSEPESPSVLLWPGKRYGLTQPVPSIRLKRLLRGVQDFEYLWLLEHNQRPAVAGLMAADLFAFGGTGCYGEHMLDSRPNGWARNPAAWSLARTIMARELTVAVEEAERHPTSQPAAPADGVTDFAHQLDWRRHVEGVRQVHTTVEGVQVRVDPQRHERPLRIRTTVSTFNATRERYDGRLTLADLPEGWAPGAEPTPLEHLSPIRTMVREVEVFASAIPTNVDGVMSLRLRVTPAEGQPAEASARVCVLTAPRLAQTVVLDGKLNEWPLATNNAAGDFILTGALDVPKENRATPDRPSQQTLVFAGRDNEYLYIAFNCQDVAMSQRVMTQGNQVRYDDLWPAGEDVIEVVLDPTGQAVVPEDLLHIIVKANGAVVTERGAACLAAIGGHGDWAGQVVAAIDDRSQPDRWTAEIRIPIASLGKTAPVWGINFARFLARSGEYASWTGARRYLYSPSSLGNIQLAP